MLGAAWTETSEQQLKGFFIKKAFWEFSFDNVILYLMSDDLGCLLKDGLFLYYAISFFRDSFSKNRPLSIYKGVINHHLILPHSK
jgi:hypothetical protein